MDRSNRLSLPLSASSFLMILQISIPGCSSVSRTVDTARLGPAHEIMVYEGGHSVLERTIAVGSEAHPDGWRPDLFTYAPSRRVRGSDFTLDFHQDRCILNYRTGSKDKWAQVSRPLRANEAVPDLFTRDVSK